MYKFITYKEWEDSYQESHPNARTNQAKTEVVLSINECDHVEPEHCVSTEEAHRRVYAWAPREGYPTYDNWQEFLHPEPEYIEEDCPVEEEILEPLPEEEGSLTEEV